MSKRKFTPPRTFICAFRSELLFMLTRSRLKPDLSRRMC